MRCSAFRLAIGTNDWFRCQSEGAPFKRAATALRLIRMELPMRACSSRPDEQRAYTVAVLTPSRAATCRTLSRPTTVRRSMGSLAAPVQQTDGYVLQTPVTAGLGRLSQPRTPSPLCEALLRAAERGSLAPEP